MHASQVKLTYQGVILLDHGDPMDRRPEFPVSGLAQVVDFAGAGTGKVFGRGNERGQVSWTRLKSWTDHGEMVGMSIALRKLVRLGVADTLTIEVEDGATFELRDFVLTDLRSEPADFPGFKAREEYSGQGGELVITNRNGLGGDAMGDVDNTELMGAAGVLFTMSEKRTY